MSRVLALTIPLATVLPGCIIYEERYHGQKCDSCGLGEVTPTPPLTTPPTSTPTDPGPELTDQVYLTVDEAAPGDLLLSELVPAQGATVDLTTIASIAFDRDIEILDSIVDPDDIVLLLSVAADAEPGDVSVTFTTTNGGEFVLAEPFHLLALPTTTTPTTTTATSGSTGDTGSTSTDTGSP
jgi:hypothetical protein